MSFLGDISNMVPKSALDAGLNLKQNKNTLDMDGFLKLIVAQFQNQDPENAADTTDMMNMLVQMSTVEAITNITDATTMMYTASLVGKEVTIGSFDSSNKLVEIVGTVTGTGTYGGKPIVFVDGVSYYLSDIMAVGRLPPKDDPDKEDPDKENPDDTKPPDEVNPPGGGDTDPTPPESGGDTNPTPPEGGGTDTTPPDGGGGTDTTPPEGGGATGNEAGQG